MSPMLSSHEGGGAWPGGLCGPLAALGGRRTLFGDGHYTGNVIQGGVTLQPQAYNLAGVGLLDDCIVVTGAATVAPDAETGAAVVMARNILVIGAGATLAPSTNSKGLLLICLGGIYYRDGGHIHVDKLGKAGNFGNLTPLDLLPTALRKRADTRLYGNFVVLGEGAPGGLGGPASSLNGDGSTGAAAGPMQSGGGGGGGIRNSHGYDGGKGGKGGPCCGGAGGAGKSGYGGLLAATLDAGDYGGPGGTANGPDGNGFTGGAGAGDPNGTSYWPQNTPPTGPGGGTLWQLAPVISIASGCLESADGGIGGNSTGSNSGGSAGGGVIVNITRPGGYSNQGTARALGGAANVQRYGTGGPGGPGSVNNFTVAE